MNVQELLRVESYIDFINLMADNSLAQFLQQGG